MIYLQRKSCYLGFRSRSRGRTRGHRRHGYCNWEERKWAKCMPLMVVTTRETWWSKLIRKCEDGWGVHQSFGIPSTSNHLWNPRNLHVQIPSYLITPLKKRPLMCNLMQDSQANFASIALPCLDASSRSCKTSVRIMEHSSSSAVLRSNMLWNSSSALVAHVSVSAASSSLCSARSCWDLGV